MIADRLRLARRKSALSLRQLAAAMHHRVTAQAIGKYERGEDQPSPAVVTALAQALHVDPGYFHSEDGVTLSGVAFRTQANTTASDRAHVQTEVLEWSERYLQLEAILELDSADWHRPAAPSQPRDPETLAAAVRQAWDLGQSPIPNMTELLEEKGLKVLTTALPPKVSGLMADVQRPGQAAVPAIVVNDRMSLERRRLTLAHELAHALFTPDQDDEKAATAFAGALLMPKAHLLREVGAQRTTVSYSELIDLKHLYRVSGAALLVRLKHVGIIAQTTLTNAFQTVAYGWRTQEPEPLEPPDQPGQQEAAQRFHRLAYRALAEGLISVDVAAHLLRRPAAQVQAGLRGPSSTPSRNFPPVRTGLGTPDPDRP